MLLIDPSAEFPYRDIAIKIALSSGIGLLVGLEREWSQKEIGVRTFAITSMLGMLTSVMSPAYVLGALGGVLLLLIFLNCHSLLRDRSLELTTSICFIVVFFLGVLVGQGHAFTAATSAVFVIMLLAWKQELERFAGALRPEEIRSAVLLGMLSVVIYPLLPNHFVDRWELLNPPAGGGRSSSSSPASDSSTIACCASIARAGNITRRYSADWSTAPLR